MVRARDKLYEFEDVPPETFAASRSAFAKGRYFNSQISNRSGIAEATPNEGDRLFLSDRARACRATSLA
ncbi:KTSC domain-containing protein [Mesorhizobium sp.]|uniref:KTSC domain-containing protein n=1 Tax=Mesorhizobium sp. TaxID=1871066 RepID=UPI00345C175F